MRVALVSIALALTACELVLDLRDDYVVAESGQGGAAQSNTIVAATATGGGAVSSGPGVGGGGSNGCNVLVFDGIDDWVSLPDNVVMDSEWRTLEAWVHWSVTGGAERTLVSTKCGSLGAVVGEFLVNVDDQCDGTDFNYETPLTSFSFNIPRTLMHIAVVSNETGYVRIYVDGIQQFASQIMGASTGTTFGSAIGTRPEDGTPYVFTQMRLYGLRIANVDMYPVMRFVPVFPLPSSAGVRANYTLQQAHTATLEDFAGTFDGVVHGDAQWTTEPCPITN